MKNPFTLSNIVTGPDFCNRKKEQNPNIKALYIDLYGTTSEREFMTRIFQQLNILESGTDKLLSLLKNSIEKFSRKQHLLSAMFWSKGRAFYQQAQAIRFMGLKRKIYHPKTWFSGNGLF
jgi:hypothetical protein